MTHATALSMIEGALPEQAQVWGDLGAGTGLFTEVLRDHLPEGSQVYALDKSPHMLWYLSQREGVSIQILDADFTREMPELSVCDTLLMANALHYVPDPENTLLHILTHLKPGGNFVLIEYEVHRAAGPYIPYPLPFHKFLDLCPKVGLSSPEVMQKVPSQYGYDHIYSAICQKEA